LFIPTDNFNAVYSDMGGKKSGNYMSKCLVMLVNMVPYDIKDNYCNTNSSEGDGNGS